MIKLKVTGMTCQHCENAVSEALSAVSGVETVISVSHEQDEVTLEGSADIELLIAAVKEEGYEAEATQ